MPSASLKLFSLKTAQSNSSMRTVKSKEWVAKYSTRSQTPSVTQISIPSTSPFLCESSAYALSSIGLVMNQLRKEGKLVDVNVICGAQNFQAHRLVLASSSPFFKELLIDDNLRNASSTLDLEDVKPDIMEMILDFIYTGQTKFQGIDTQKILQLMTTAHLLQISTAASYFCEMLLQSKPNHNLTALWNWSDEYKNIETENIIMNYILKNFNVVRKLHDFGDLSLDRLISIFTQPILSHPKYQDMVMQAILIWVKHNIDERKEKIHYLIPFVSIEHLSNALKQCIGKEPLLQSIPEINSAAVFKETSSKLKLKSKDINPEKNIKNNETAKNFKVADFHNETQKAEVFTLDEKKFDFPATELAVTQNTRVIDKVLTEPMAMETGTIVLVAGRDDGNRFVWQCYIPSLDTWTKAKELNTPIKDKEGFAYYKSKLYLIAGENNHSSKLREMYIYDMKTQTMKQGSPLWVGRASPTVVTSDHFIFTIGGVSRFEKPMTHVECLNVKSGIWRILPPIKEKRSDPGTAVLNNNIYLIGGHTTRCEYYNIIQDNWYSITSLPNYFQDSEMVSFPSRGKIYAFRSFRPERICCYDPQSNKWHMLKTTKQSPENILNVALGLKHVWCLDKNCKLLYLDTTTLCWKMNISLPHRLSKPQHLAVIRLDEKI